MSSLGFEIQDPLLQPKSQTRQFSSVTGSDYENHSDSKQQNYVPRIRGTLSGGKKSTKSVQISTIQL